MDCICCRSACIKTGQTPEFICRRCGVAYDSEGQRVNVDRADIELILAKLGKKGE